MSVVDLTNAIATNKVAVCNPDGTAPLLVATSGVAPVGGGITWGAPQEVTLTGASQTLAAANAIRKGLIIQNRIGNTQITYDLSGSVVTLIKGEQMNGGQRDWYTGAECPVNAVTVIGTAAQLVTFIEGT